MTAVECAVVSSTELCSDCDLPVDPLVIVRLVIDNGSFQEVLRDRRRLDGPFESGGPPGIGPSDFSILPYE